MADKKGNSKIRLKLLRIIILLLIVFILGIATTSYSSVNSADISKVTGVKQRRRKKRQKILWRRVLVNHLQHHRRLSIENITTEKTKDRHDFLIINFRTFSVFRSEKKIHLQKNAELCARI